MSVVTMTPKERILTAIRGGIPDTVPVQVGTYEMLPAKATGLPWWDVFLYRKVELWKYRIDLIKELQFDGYLYVNLTPHPGPNDQRTYTYQMVRMDDEYHVQRVTIHTPHGDLWEEHTYPRQECETVTRGLIKTKEDFEIYLEHFFPGDTAYTAEGVREPQKALGDLGVVGGSLAIPGLHDLANVFDGRLAAATYFNDDYPELIEEYRRRMERQTLRELEHLLDVRPDYVTIGSSGLLTLSNPRMFRTLSLPTIKKICHLCREAGVPSELHSCGKQRYTVEVCANETELDSINPLQPPPMGDCDLAEVKRSFGKRLCLKGNVGVTEPMLLGTPADVERDVVRCLEAAKAGGGYILFTEEQLGRDTPYENIRTMIATARRLGSYA